jgi:hypothetical protein
MFPARPRAASFISWIGKFSRQSAQCLVAGAAAMAARLESRDVDGISIRVGYCRRLAGSVFPVEH